MAIWPFAPDWTSEVRITYEFLTEIITSRAGKEQRIAQRDVPRITLEFTSLVIDADLRSMMARLSADHNETIQMPEWSRPVSLAGAVSAGSTLLVASSLEAWMTPGANLAMIWQGIGGVEYTTSSVASLSGSNVTLSTPVAINVPAEAQVFRLWTGHLDVSIATTFEGDRANTVSVKFSVDPGFETLASALGAGLTFGGREVMILEPDWSKTVSVDFMTVLETVDYGMGRKAFKAPVAFNDRILKCGYLASTAAETDNFVNLFIRSFGQQREFFMPTFTEDLKLRSPAANAATSIRVIGSEVSSLYGASSVYDTIAVGMSDGTFKLHSVTSIVSVSDSTGSDSVINISPALDGALTLDNVDRLCWLPVWRFASDQMVVQWLSTDIANIGATFKTLESLSVES